MQQKMIPLRQRMKKLLEEGANGEVKKTAGLCRALLKREKALWRFVQVKGLEPTNNLAERMLRPAVIWRKKSFGNVSQRGCRYVERMLSVIQTLRLRKVSVLDYLQQAVAAHRKGLVAPEMMRKRESSEQRIGRSGNGGAGERIRADAADPQSSDQRPRRGAKKGVNSQPCCCGGKAYFKCCSNKHL